MATHSNGHLALLNEENKRTEILEVTSAIAAYYAIFTGPPRKCNLSDNGARSTSFFVMREATINLKAPMKSISPMLILAEGKGFTPPLGLELIPVFNFNTD